MDPGTLPVLAAANPDCRFVVPRAEAATAISRGIEEQRLILLDAGQSHELGEGLSVTATPAAHETVEVDAEGHHRFLGYILRAGNYCLYHSGDTIPFAGLAEALSSHSIDVALLPVNGRDAFRRQRGVPGNMTFAEAADLCRQLKVAAMVPHHFEMFDFNTVDRESLLRQVASWTSDLRIVLPETGVIIQVVREGDEDESRN